MHRLHNSGWPRLTWQSLPSALLRVCGCSWIRRSVDVRQLSSPRCEISHSHWSALLFTRHFKSGCSACRGYKLLQQMGYREGKGVGASESGRSDPLDVIIKPGRTGLGIDEGRKRHKAEVAKGQQARGKPLARSCQYPTLAWRFCQLCMSKSVKTCVCSTAQQALLDLDLCRLLIVAGLAWVYTYTWVRSWRYCCNWAAIL